MKNYNTLMEFAILGGKNEEINLKTMVVTKIFNKYKCKHCGKIEKRKSNKQWVKSFCEETGKNVHLTLI